NALGCDGNRGRVQSAGHLGGVEQLRLCLDPRIAARLSRRSRACDRLPPPRHRRTLQSGLRGDGALSRHRGRERRPRRRSCRRVASRARVTPALSHQCQYRRRQESGRCGRVGAPRLGPEPTGLRRTLPTLTVAAGVIGTEEAGMKRIIAAWVAAIFAALVASSAPAQTSFPARTVKFIVPFPGGGINGVLAPITGNKLQAKWGQPVVVENKTGAGGNIGADLAYQSEPDGYTLLLSPPGPLAINQTLYKHLSYKPQEFVPITVVGSVPNVVIVRKELPVTSLKELIDYVRANPGKVTFGSQGNGATPHLTA